MRIGKKRGGIWFVGGDAREIQGMEGRLFKCKNWRGKRVRRRGDVVVYLKKKKQRGEGLCEERLERREQGREIHIECFN